MSKLEELIQQYCPDGVEYLRLGDCIKSLNTGLNPRKFFKLNTDDATNYYVTIREMHYNTIVFNDGTDRLNDEALRLCNNRSNLEKGDVLFSGTGTIGEVATIEETPSNWNIKEGVYAIKPMSNLLNYKYLMYLLQSSSVKQDYLKKAAGGTVKSVPMAEVRKLEIPVPPIPVQEEIVRILDTFTELQAELQAELQKRKQQYNYYLDNLLSFNDINRGGQAEVRWMKMSDIGTFYSGLSGKTKEDFQNGNAKFISYMNIFNNPSLITDVDDRVKILEGEKQNTIQYGDLLFTGSSETPDECGMCSVLTHHTEEKLYLNSFCFGFRFNDLSGINPEFMKFLFRSSVIRKLICKTANGVTRFNISKKEFAKIVIPIPSLAEQDHIASVLDKFYFLVGDLTAGLPAEIEKRKQQYEYYRDKLLTFKRKGA